MNEKNKAEVELLISNQLKLQDSFRACFDTSDGKAVLEYLKKKFFYRKTTQVFGVPGKTEYNNGQRDVVEAIVDFIESDKETLVNRIRTKNYERY